jgi:replication factor C subunit 2/4
LDQGGAKRRVEEIAEKEGVKLEDGAADALIKCSEGDLRKAITFLQSAARLVGAVSLKEDEDENAMDIDGKESKIVTVKSIEDIAGVIPDETIEKLVKAMQPKSKGLTYEAVAKVVTEMVADGWSGTQVVSQVCCPRNNTQLKAKSISALPIHYLQRINSRRTEEQDHPHLLRSGQTPCGWF